MILSEQKSKKPSYEELSPMLISGQTKEIFDELIAYLRSIKLIPRWYATNAYNVKFKGKMILRFTMNKNNEISLFFTVANIAELDNIISSIAGDMRKFYFDNLRICTGCNPAHNGGRKVTIQGEIYGCCAEPEMRIDNLSLHHIEYLKNFIQVRKDNINKRIL